MSKVIIKNRIYKNYIDDIDDIEAVIIIAEWIEQFKNKPMPLNGIREYGNHTIEYKNKKNDNLIIKITDR